jgi:hypothetical protein
MTFSPISSDDTRNAAALKGLWEDPCITLERELEARAQGGSPDSQSELLGILGPMGNQELGTCTSL